MDERQASILDRYKYYNGTEGNSMATDDMAPKIGPDIEDINQDNTMNETEKYYEYTIELDLLRCKSAPIILLISERLR